MRSAQRRIAGGRSMVTLAGGRAIRLGTLRDTSCSGSSHGKSIPRLEDEEFTVASAYSADPRDDRAGDGTPGTGSSAWKDSGRPGSGERVFDVNAGRRRPVVFEEDDDLDVPDFLK